MVRSVLKQCPGNPLQYDLLPQQPLELEFAYHKSVDNDDATLTRRILRELLVLSTAVLMSCYLTENIELASPLTMLVAVLTIAWSWRTATAEVVSFGKFGVLVILGVLGLNFVSMPRTLAVYVSLLANVLLAREVVRHFVYLATVAPMPLEAAWRRRIRLGWETLLSSLLLLPLFLAIMLPAYALWWLTGLLCGLIAWCVLRIDDFRSMAYNIWDAIRSWCTYHRESKPIPGVLVSPSGPYTLRLLMLLAVVLWNSVLVYRCLEQFHVLEAMSLSAENMTPDRFLNWIIECLLLGALVVAPAVLPLVLCLFSIAVIGLPVWPYLTLPKPSYVPASQWQAITQRLRLSRNEVEKHSLYLGRLSHDQSPLLVPTKVFHEHAHFLGDSGSGKTARGLAPLIEQILGSGNASVMVIDLKGDSPELLQTLRQGSRTAHRLADVSVPVKYFSVRDDQATYAFNPFGLACWSKLNTLQKTDTLCAALGLHYGTDYGEGYYSSANAAVLYKTISEFPAIASFEQLKDKLAYVMKHAKSLGLADKTREAGNHVQMSATRLADIAALNVTEESAPNKIVHLCALDPSKLFERPEAHFYSLSATLGPGASPEVARLAVYMLLVSATLAKGKKVPVYLVIDEFQRMASRNLDYLLQLARSMGVAVILANQSMQDLRRHDLVATLETNCRYRQWFAVSSFDDQLRLSQASGESVDWQESESIGHSTGEHGTTLSINLSRRQYLTPRLGQNVIKLASDDDRKSIVLINRGEGYAQYGGMPIVVENDFHISEKEFKARKNAPWPTATIGTFVPAKWLRPKPEVPHRGRKKTQLEVTQETIELTPKLDKTTVDKSAPGSQTTRRGSKKRKPQQGQGKSKRNAPHSRASKRGKPRKASTQSSGLGSFERYLEDHPLEPPTKAAIGKERA